MRQATLDRSTLAVGELGAVQVGVAPTERQQLSVRARLHDATAVDHQDLVGAADGGQPVRDDQRRAAGQRGVQRVLDGDLGLAVQVRGRLVEDHDARAP